MVLEQTTNTKVLNSQLPIHICVSGGAYSSISEVAPPTLISSKPQLELTKKPFYTGKEILAEHLQGRIKKCKESHWKHLVCADCGEIVEPQVTKMHCFNRYCDDSHCTVARILRAKNKLKTYFRYTKRVKEFVISFEWRPDYSRDVKKKYERVLTLFFAQLRKFGCDIPAIRTFDFLKDDDGFFLHFSFVALPLEKSNFDIHLWNLVRERIERTRRVKFHISMARYRNKKQAVNYQANRIAGVYGHAKDHNDFMLKDIMTLPEFIENFYKMKTYVKVGKDNLSDLNFEASYYEGLSSLMGLTLPETCPKCSSRNLKLMSDELYNINEAPPPPKYAISSYIG